MTYARYKKMTMEIQKDLDEGRFNSICSNERTFKDYVFLKLKFHVINSIDDEIARWQRVKSDMDVIICDCGKPYNDSDPAVYINTQISHLQKQKELIEDGK